MRPTGQPVLSFAASLCDGCAITQCAERMTDAACDERHPRTAVVDVTEPDRLGQFISLADGPVAIASPAPVPTIPPYTAVLPARPQVLAVLPTLPARSIGFKFSDYLQLARAADRAGTTVRDNLGIGDRRIVVVGSDAHRKCISYFYRWPQLLPLIERHPPDLLVPPDLGVYEADKPIVRYLHHFAGQRMYRDLAERGIGALPPFGWRMMSDIRLVAGWVRVYEIPGLFIDAQGWQQRGLDELLDDVAAVRGLFPERFSWLVNGTVRLETWRQMRTVLGNVRITSGGVFHEGRNNKVFSYDGAGGLRRIRSAVPVGEAIAQSIHALSAAAEHVFQQPQERVRVVRVGAVARRRREWVR